MADEQKTKLDIHHLRVDADADGDAILKFYDQDYKELGQFVLMAQARELMIQRLVAAREGWIQLHSSETVH